MTAARANRAPWRDPCARAIRPPRPVRRLYVGGMIAMLPAAIRAAQYYRRNPNG